MHVILALLTALGGAAPLLETQQPVRLVLLDTAVLSAPRLNESSGVASSRRRPGLLWTHNDSGDGPVLYATDSGGNDLGSVRVEGARAIDWEDMSAGPCVSVAASCLYVGDIGDNEERRRRVVIYRLLEPEPPRSAADTEVSVPLQDSIVLRYPDRAHDAEAMAITPAGHLLLITKGRTGPAVLFRAVLTPETREATLERVGALDITISPFLGRLVTGAAVSSDGTLLVVRTYVSLHLFRLQGGGLPTPLTPPAGLTIPVVETQGEAVTFDGSGRLVLTSERGDGGHAVLTRLLIDGVGHQSR